MFCLYWRKFYRFETSCCYLCRDLSNGPQFYSGRHMHRKKLGRRKYSGNSFCLPKACIVTIQISQQLSVEIYFAVFEITQFAKLNTVCRNYTCSVVMILWGQCMISETEFISQHEFFLRHCLWQRKEV